MTYPMMDAIEKANPDCKIDATLHIGQYKTKEFSSPPSIPVGLGEKCDLSFGFGPWFMENYECTGVVENIRPDGTVTITSTMGWIDHTDRRPIATMLRFLYNRWLHLRWNVLSFFGKV